MTAKFLSRWGVFNGEVGSNLSVVFRWWDSQKNDSSGGVFRIFDLFFVEDAIIFCINFLNFFSDEYV